MASLERQGIAPMLRAVGRHFDPVVIVGAPALVIALVFADAVARFASATSAAFVGELVRLGFVSMTDCGGAYAARARRRRRVTVLVDRAPPGLRRAVPALAETIFLARSLVACRLGVVITAAVERGQTLSTTGRATAVPYAGIGLSGAIPAARLIHSIRRIGVRSATDFAPRAAGRGPRRP